MDKEKKTKAPFFNLNAWLGYDLIRDSASAISGLTKNLFSYKKKKFDPETFEQAMQRLRMSEEDLVLRLRNAKKQFMLYFILTVLAIIYSIIAFIYFSFVHGLVCLMVIAYFGVQAFKQHFWMFQMKQRRLGCTLQEWRKSLWG